MSTRFATVNGVNIAFRVQGEGPPLVLVMGYRLGSAAWPVSFIEALGRQFSVITLDNRGTGQSEKPVGGYAIANMARDLAGLLDQLEMPRAHILGYSMGGAIAQEFARQFPERVSSLVLCATMCGGPRAIYAPLPVARVMRELDGLEPEEIARRIWKVTYSPGYLETNRGLAEDQMRREIAAPTPLHAADLQFQAFAEFDCSRAVPDIQSPTLVLTGELDQLISPQNSRLLANLIPGARLVVIPSCGHRLMWEATDECVAIVTEFLTGAHDTLAASVSQNHQNPLTRLVDFIAPAMDLFIRWPWMWAGAGLDVLSIARQSVYFGGNAQFGDGKPIILVPQLDDNLSFILLANWLKLLGYRPVLTGISPNFDDQSVANLMRDTTRRIGRKAVLVVANSGLKFASAIAETHKDRVSDIVVLNSVHRADVPPRVRWHFISSGWSLPFAMAALPQTLHNIAIELIDRPGAPAQGHSGLPGTMQELSAEG